MAPSLLGTGGVGAPENTLPGSLGARSIHFGAVKTNRFERLDPAFLVRPAGSWLRWWTDPVSRTNLTMCHPLTLQPNRFHLALYAGMRMMVAFVV